MDKDPVDDAIARLLVKWLLDKDYISGVSADPGGYMECYIDRSVWPDGKK